MEPGEDLDNKDDLGKTFNLDGPVNKKVELEVQQTTSNACQEILKLHVKLSHISIHRLQRMARNGQIPARLESIGHGAIESLYHYTM